MSRVRAILPTIVDLVLPTAGFYALHAAGMSTPWALTVAGSATGVVTLVNTVRRRRLDAIGLLVVVEITASVLLTVFTHDARLILLRPSLYVAVAGVVCVVSCLTGRPLTYTGATPLATKGDPARVVAYDVAWSRSAEIRRIHRQLTVFVGLCMIAYAGVRAVFAYALPVTSAVLAQEVPGLVMIALILLALRLRVPRLRHIVDEVQADLARGRDGSDAALSPAAP